MSTTYPPDLNLTLPDPYQDAESRIEATVEKYQAHVNPGLASLMKFGGFGDLEEYAEGCLLRTASGAEFLDCLGGYGVFSVGHRHPKVVAAVKAQLDRLPLSTKTFFNERMGDLAAKLSAIAPGDLQYVFFSNSGTEAVEAALKMARIATGKTGFISTEGSYHGKTLGALSVTGREKYRTPFEPLLPGATFVPYNDAGAVARAITPETAAVIVETLQGEGGINVPDADYLPALRRLCDAHDILLIADEVQTGLGRTGAMFGCDHAGVAPDIMTLAKALGGGVMPIGATLSTPAVWDRIFGQNPLLHTSTFGGNPLACAAGLAAIAVIEEENLIAAARERGAQMLDGLRGIQKQFPETLTDVRGLGLMIGVEFAMKDVAELTINLLAGRGVVAAYTLNNPKVIRLEPPLVITEAQVAQVLSAFAEAVELAAAMLSEME